MTVPNIIFVQRGNFLDGLSFFGIAVRVVFLLLSANTICIPYIKRRDTLLRKALDIIGLPVLEIESGKEMGHVRDVLFDDQWVVRGVLLENKTWFTLGKYIPDAHIVAYGEDAVTISNSEAIAAVEHDQLYHGILTGNSRMKGVPVVTSNGNQLGLVEDVYFQAETGEIVGCELSEGFISDIKEGRYWLKRPDKITLGTDAIIVPTHCCDELQKL